MTNPWTTTVKCQGPKCAKEAKVTRPGEVRPGWMVLVKQSAPLANQQAQVEQHPFCSLTCLHNWAAARLPSKQEFNGEKSNKEASLQ